MSQDMPWSGALTPLGARILQGSGARRKEMADRDLEAARIEDLRGIKTEIGAGKTFSSSPEGQVWNSACDRAIAIVESYMEGCGLFQLTRQRATGEHK